VKREPLRLGRGEYTASARDLEREEFIEAIFKVVPESGTLMDEALNLLSDRRDTPFVWDEFRERITQTAVAWAKRWHLLDDWCVRIAVELCSVRSARDDWLERWFRPLYFEYPAPSTTGYTRAKFRQAVHARLDQILDKYCDDLERWADARFDKMPDKRSAAHFAWLARHVAGGESMPDIWRSLLQNHKRRSPGELSRQAVVKAIEQTAADIGLTLHNSKK